MRSRQKPLALGEAPKQEVPLLHTPFPGMIDGNRWTVKQARNRVYIDRSHIAEEGGIMHVPLGGDDVERKLRLHEQGHTTWSPLVSEEDVAGWGVQGRTIEACEDGRIINRMAWANANWKRVNETVSVLDDNQVDGYQEWFNLLYRKLAGEKVQPLLGMDEPSLVEAARLVAASRGYLEGATFDNLFRPLPWIKELVEDMHSRHIAEKEGEAEFSDTVAYAQELERRFSEIEDQLLGEAAAAQDANMPPQFIDLDEETGDDHFWGEMVIERVPLPERLRHSDARRTRAHDTGAVPRYMHRLVSDQRVFGRKRKEKHFQGTVLIDHSGSMSLSTDQVDEMLRRWPAVTIATYSGEYNGVLRIVAEKGKRAARQHLSRPDGMGNCVDGPALDWLAKQRGPRIWISDGQVSGQGEDFRPWFRKDATQKVIRGRIKRIENVQDLLGS